MQKPILLLMLATLLSLPLAAQPSKVTSGVLDFQNGNVGEAIEKLEAALAAGEENPDLFRKGKAKYIAKAHYYLHAAYARVARDTSLKDLQAQYPDAALLAADHLDLALNHEYGKQWQTRATLDNASMNVWYSLYSGGVDFFNEANYDRATAYFLGADKANPNHFLTTRMLGTAQLMQEDTAAAIASLEKALNLFKARYMDNEDEKALEALKATSEYEEDLGQISYVAQQLAVIYNAQGDPRKALDVLKVGEEIDPNDPDMKRQELNIYNQNPELFEEAVSKFESAIAENPDDDQIKLAYASLLERNERAEDALAIYQEVYEKDPNNLLANYGLGASYINQAAEISQVKMATDNEEKIAEYDKQIIALLRQAYPYMKKLHELQPTEREWLSQLVSITGNLSSVADNDEEAQRFEEEMTLYGKKLGELNQ
ncbi:MAG: hypothetical protein D6722_08670 [Bacteroidetes bacterium]|nr:MAG: hypothetical protein D6722_08670 [Bacteroidota bacterium]